MLAAVPAVAARCVEDRARSVLATRILVGDGLSVGAILAGGARHAGARRHRRGARLSHGARPVSVPCLRPQPPALDRPGPRPDLRADAGGGRALPRLPAAYG